VRIEVDDATEAVEVIRLLQQPAAPRVSEPSLAVVPKIPTHNVEALTCERCGKAFTRTTGSSGRFCSRVCYAGSMSVEERRERIVTALREGPSFAALLHQRPELAAVSNGTISNDLQVLRREGLVVNSDEGWRLKSSELGVQDGSEDPFAPTNFPISQRSKTP
jgi:hypothetical protein